MNNPTRCELSEYQSSQTQITYINQSLGEHFSLLLLHRFWFRLGSFLYISIKSYICNKIKRVQDGGVSRAGRWTQGNDVAREVLLSAMGECRGYRSASGRRGSWQGRSALPFPSS